MSWCFWISQQWTDALRDRIIPRCGEGWVAHEGLSRMERSMGSEAAALDNLPALELLASALARVFHHCLYSLSGLLTKPRTHINPLFSRPKSTLSALLSV